MIAIGINVVYSLIVSVCVATLGSMLLGACTDAEDSAIPTHAPLSLDTQRIEHARNALTVSPDTIATVPTIYTEDMVYKEPLLTVNGIDEMVSFLEKLLELTPDYVLAIDTEVYDGETYSATWVMKGSFAGFSYEAPGMSIVKFHPGGNKIYFQRDYYSEGDVWANVPNYGDTVKELRDIFEDAVAGNGVFDVP